MILATRATEGEVLGEEEVPVLLADIQIQTMITIGIEVEDGLHILLHEEGEEGQEGEDDDIQIRIPILITIEGVALLGDAATAAMTTTIIMEGAEVAGEEDVEIRLQGDVGPKMTEAGVLPLSAMVEEEEEEAHPQEDVEPKITEAGVLPLLAMVEEEEEVRLPEDLCMEIEVEPIPMEGRE
jgi:hypothetical protein